jgi:fructose-bisphosphate aldolase class II
MVARFLKFWAASLVLSFIVVGNFVSYRENSYEYISRRVLNINMAVPRHRMLVSSKSIIDMVREARSKGVNAAVMAVNPRSLPRTTIKAIMQVAKDTRTPIIFELAASEMNVDPNAKLTAAYTGLTPQMLADIVNSIAAEIDMDVPFALHGDHITVSENTPKAKAAARALIEAEKAAGFTSFAIDASKLMIIDDAKLLTMLNAMTEEDLMRIPGIGSIVAGNILDHGDFSNLDELKDVEGIDEAKAEVIKTYLELKDIIDVTEELARIVPESAGLEVEVGEIGRKDPVTGQQELTKVIQTAVFIDALQLRGIHPDLLAINDGSAHGNAYDDQGRPIPKTTVDTGLIGEVSQEINPRGVDVAKHATTGSTEEIKRALAGLGVAKINVGTNWQNIVLKNLPREIIAKMEAWVWANFGSERNTVKNGRPVYNSDEQFIGQNIKFANKPLFRGEFGEVPADILQRIYDEAYQSASGFFRDFGSLGLVDIVE